MIETTQPQQTGRAAAALGAGFLVVVLLSVGTDALMHGTGIFPPMGQPMETPLWLLASVYRAIFGILGSYVAAKLAPARPMFYALVLGVIGTVLATAGVIGTWNEGPEYGPKWYSIGLAVTALPWAWVGGRLAGKTTQV
ncbi:hypothetical protein [Bryobacter aggregatus]|uniref:hypothetical protein n=1 Tax=Bryobacter aggregatus TaxID=360054 RepID=UPI0004E1C313|nr:hypothetical protein [Bryobacter aggregatus]